MKACLEGPADSSIAQQPVKYLVYKLPGESALIGVECVICLEEFVKGGSRALSLSPPADIRSPLRHTCGKIELFVQLPQQYVIVLLQE